MKSRKQRIAEIEEISKQELTKGLVDVDWHMIRGEKYVAELALPLIQELQQENKKLKQQLKKK